MDLAPLFDVRLRTPRLELRLPTDGDLADLYRVAEAGIHPPEEMPFEIPWTDTLAEEPFLAFHREARERWSPDRWAFNLATFGGKIVTSSLFTGQVVELEAGTLRRFWTTKVAPETRYVAISLWPR